MSSYEEKMKKKEAEILLRGLEADTRIREENVKTVKIKNKLALMGGRRPFLRAGVITSTIVAVVGSLYGVSLITGKTAAVTGGDMVAAMRQGANAIDPQHSYSRQFEEFLGHATVPLAPANPETVKQTIPDNFKLFLKAKALELSVSPDVAGAIKLATDTGVDVAFKQVDPANVLPANVKASQMGALSSMATDYFTFIKDNATTLKSDAPDLNVMQKAYKKSIDIQSYQATIQAQDAALGFTKPTNTPQAGAQRALPQSAPDSKPKAYPPGRSMRLSPGVTTIHM